MKIFKKIKMRGDKVVSSFAIFSMIVNVVSPFAAMYPVRAFAEDVATPVSETSVETQAPSEEPVKVEEPSQPEQEVASTPEATSEDPVDAQTPEEPTNTEPTVTPTEPTITPTEPEITTETSSDNQPGDILPDGVSDYRPVADVNSTETQQTEVSIDPASLPLDTAPTVSVDISTSEPAVDETSGTEPAVVAEIPTTEPVKEYEVLTDGAEIKDSVEADWKVNGDKAETKEIVKIGVRYIFPLDKDVTVTFTKLPNSDSDRSTLKIEKVRASDINLPTGVIVDGEYGYDITTGMKNESFEYDLTLPKTGELNTEVIYIEKSIEDLTKSDVNKDEIKTVEDSMVKQGDGKTTVSGLDHFTPFFNILKDEPKVTTDKGSYKPGDEAVISGKGFPSETDIELRITDPNNLSISVNLKTDNKGDFDYKYIVTGLKGEYLVEVLLGGVAVAQTTFKDPGNPSADLDQYANDTPVGWVNGNLGASKATYFEGDSVPYRLRFSNLSLGTHNVTIEWDTTKSSKHALDYITSYDRSVPSADPCVDVTGCNKSVFDAFNIPADSQVTGAGITPIPGDFKLFGGSVTSVSTYSYADGTGFTGDKSARITITFTASVANPVLAWGGHIADRSDWGANDSAISIPGSPYHTRLISLDGGGGNQDRSLSAEAVIFPASITIIKDATPNGSTSFSFTASPSPLTNFSLVDDGTSANTKLFSDILDFQTYTVTENTPTGWSLGTVVCSVDIDNGGSQTVSGATATINLKEGENVICTYPNTQQNGTLIVKKVVINDNGGTKTASDFGFEVNGGSTIAFETDGQNDLTVSTGTYTIVEPSVSGYTTSYDNCANVFVPAGGSATCTITNDDQAATLTVIKHVINDNGGTKVAGDFTITVTGISPSPASFAGVESPGTTVSISAGPYSVNEGAVSGYSKSLSTDCSGTIANGQSKTCTITNDDIAPTLTIVKKVINDNGGNETVSAFGITVDGSTPAFDGGVTVGDTTIYTAVVPDALANHPYLLSENDIKGYTEGNWDCVNNSALTDDLDGELFGVAFLGISSTTYTETLSEGQNVTCTIINDDIAPTLNVVKRVINDNGGTAVVGDFGIVVNGSALSFDQGIPSGSSVTYSAIVTGALANTSYIPSENALKGYQEGTWVCLDDDTQNVISIPVTLDEGQSVTCKIINDDLANGQLFIEKINDKWPNVQHIGDVVTYTITVRAVGGPLHDVVVTDLPPAGFSYVQGSWTPKTIPEPTYSSPGEWDIGDMTDGQEIVLTYQTEIQSGVTPGIYPDLAWADGVNLSGDSVYATSESNNCATSGCDDGIVSENFVGTKVSLEVIPEIKETAEVKVKHEEKGEVLGASTELPATGISPAWINAVLSIAFLGGLLMLIGGMGTMLRKETIKKTSTRRNGKIKKVLVMFAVIAGMGMLFTARSYAQETAVINPLVVRIEEPDSPTSKSFNLSFVVLDIEQRDPITSKCYKKFQTDSNFTQFGSDVVISNSEGGNSHNCAVDSGVLNKVGTYEFQVKAYAGDDQSDSDIVTVKFDNTSPDRPKYIEKDKKSSCKYEVSLRTADDGQTSYVWIYRDFSRDMDLNMGNRIKTKNLGPDEKYTFTDELYGGDCGHTPYYAVIAFNAIGNHSEPRAETVVKTVTVTTTETKETAGAIEVLGGANLPSGTEGGTGGQIPSGSEAGGEGGAVLGETVTNAGLWGSVLNVLRSPWFWLIILVVGFIIVRVFKKKNKK